MEGGSNLSVSIKISSRKDCYNLIITEKATFIQGDSGKGKTSFTRAASSSTGYYTTVVSNGFELYVLTERLFRQSCEDALRKKRYAESETGRTIPNERFLKEYWSQEENFPHENRIIIIDDEAFIASKSFKIFYEASKSCYFIFISRDSLSDIGYSINEVYDFVAEGRNHFLKPKYSYKNSPTDKISCVVVEGIGSDYIFFKELFSQAKVFNPTSLGTLKSGGRNT